MPTQQQSRLLLSVGGRFDPLRIGQPSLVLDGDSVARFGNGVGISQWDDISGLANHVVQATGGAQPLADNTQGWWSGKFDGINDFLRSAAQWSTATSWTSFVVCKLANGADNIVLGDNAGNNQMRAGQGGDTLSMFDGVNNPITGTLAIALGSWMLLEYGRDGSGNALFWQNGVAYSTGTINASLGWDSVGTSNGAGAWTNGYLAYVVHYPFSCNDAQRVYVEKGLNSRYPVF